MEKVINIEKSKDNGMNYTLFDIETTGLNKTKDFMYMFGICEKEKDKLIYTQYYIEDKNDEKELIEKLNIILENKTAITYNGDRFDFPFIRKRAKIHSVEFTNKNTIDIFRQFQKLNFILKEPNLKAINLGKRLGLEVHDYVSQNEMPTIFKMYSELKNKENLSKLIYHNYIDLFVLSHIYEYKINTLDNFLKINNKNFTGVIKTAYIQKNFLVIRLTNPENLNIDFSNLTFNIKSNINEIKIELELSRGILQDGSKGLCFRQNRIKNVIFTDSSDLKNNMILLFKNDNLLLDNLLKILNLLII